MAGKRSRNAFEVDLQRQESPYVIYGTPLPPLDDHIRDDGSFVPVWKQEVTDDRGRKRLHGAFTGGFSAGYYNTVGSKEGWTPSTFVSSRQARQRDGAAAVEQRPEDFMDEEDLREAEEARNLDTSDAFAGFGSTAQDSMRTAGFMDILRPTDETIGSKLLKKMGWKEGQGIGPKVRRAADVGDEEYGLNETHLFAPKAMDMISLSRKTDHKGLGYKGEDSLEIVTSNKRAYTNTGQIFVDEHDRPSAKYITAKTAAAGVASNRAFGIGILNDTGSDDEDPYEIGPKISYTKVIGVEKKPKKGKDITQASASSFLKNKPTFLSKKLLATKASGFGLSRDGRLPLDGFVLANELDSFSSISLQDDSMKPTVVPEDWKSAKIRIQGTEGKAHVSVADAARASLLNAQGRASLLGEKQLPGKSVFDFLSPAARDKLAIASGKADLPQAGSQPPPSGHEASSEAKQRFLQNLVPELDSQVALQALDRGVSGWMPYAEDESKRDRYRTFLEIRADLLNQLPIRAQNMTQVDWVNEMNEFARAAQVFKSVTGLMASRFTSSAAPPDSVHGSDEKSKADVMLKKPALKTDEPGIAAAKLGMFGPMTRSVINFYPSRLVCKRFNVQPPGNALDSGNGSDINSSQARQPRPSQFDAYQYAPAMTADAALTKEDNVCKLEAEGVPVAAEEQRQLVSVDPEKNEALEKEKPGEDVFRAVFGSDDDSDDD